MAKKSYFSLSEQERVILYFLWRVKVAPTSLLFLRFEHEFCWKESTAYKRMLILKRKGCVEIRTDNSGSFRVWGLTLKGFKAIRDRLLALKEEGFASEKVTHDLLATIIHYGEWLPFGSTPDVRIVTEQELRRIDPEEWPRVLKLFESHRPDGIWYFPETESKTLYVLELELSRKRTRDYERLGWFYRDTKGIHSVLWVVQTRGQGHSIREALQPHGNVFRDIHNFVLFDEVKKFGWASEIFVGPNAGESIHNFLEKARRNHAVAATEATHHRNYVERMMNFHLTRFNSRTSESA